jgi:hypothetical protein
MKYSQAALAICRAFWLGAAIQGLGLILSSTCVQAAPSRDNTIISGAVPTVVVSPSNNLNSVNAPVNLLPSGSVNNSSDPSSSTPSIAAPPAPTSPAPGTTVAPEPPAEPIIPAKPVSISNPLQILTPTTNSVVDIPAATVIVQYLSSSPIELKVNGQLVDSKSIGRTETDTKTNIVTQTWYGVSLNAGDNIIVAQDSQGNTAVSKVQVRGVPTKVQLTTKESRVPADGRSLVTIEGQLLDENGNNSKRDGVVTLYSTAGEFAGVDKDRDQPGFQVPVVKGYFSAPLRSNLTAQNVQIRAAIMSLEATTQVQFETNLRSSIATGLLDLRVGARGTDYYRSFTEFLPTDRNNNTEVRLRGQGFGTGRIGDWSVTGALNSDRPLNKVCNTSDRLFRDTSSTQSCEDLYPVYGDTSKVEALTPSRDSVYVKLESSVGVAGSTPNSLLWGDYNTTEFANRSQQFTTTSRNLHGAKLNYNFGNLLVSGFYGDNLQGFQRDNIAPDGTSGFYFLSQRLLLGGTESLSVETEEIDRPGNVVKVEPLARGLDYEIDYDRGTVLLRQPLLRTAVTDSGNLLVRRLVATYQYANGSNSNIVGSRAQFNFNRTNGQESWLAGSYTKETQGIRDFSIFGVDGLISLGNSSNIIAEYARSTNNTGLGDAIGGSAFRVEGQFKFSDATQGRAYLRSSEAGFANNATTSFVPGQTRYGADLTTRIGSSTSLRLQADREENRGVAPIAITGLTNFLTPSIPLTGQVDNDLTTITAGIQQRFGNNATVDLDYVNRSRQDRLATLPGQSDVSSNQIRTRVGIPLGNNLTLRGQNEINLSNQQDVVYPNRTALGVDWAVYPGVNLRLSQNYVSSAQFGDSNYTSLDFDSTYNLTSSTKVIGRYSLSPFQSIGSVGLQQGFVLSPGLKLDLNYERVIGGITNVSGAGQQFAQPVASGQVASSLTTTGGDTYGIGFNYTDNANFQANARYELRNTNISSSSLISAGATGKLGSDLTALFRYQQSGAANQLLRDAPIGDTTNLKLGLALRNPAVDQWNALLSYQYRKNPALLPSSILTASGTGSEDHTLSLDAIYAPSWQWEFAGKYALRNATSYLDQSLSAGNTIGISQLRTTYRLGYNWDLTGDVRWLSQFASGRNETGASLEAGYYLTPNLRFSGGYSLGAADDPNGNRTGGGLYAGVTLKLNDLLGGFGQQQLSPIQQQESKIK